MRGFHFVLGRILRIRWGADRVAAHAPGGVRPKTSRCKVLYYTGVYDSSELVWIRGNGLLTPSRLEDLGRSWI